MKRKNFFLSTFMLSLVFVVGTAFADILPSSSGNTSTVVAPSAPSVSTSTQQPVASDSMITTELQAKLTNDSRLVGANITVVTQDGSVTLQGTATTREQMTIAIEAARTTPGVKTVKSNLTLSGSPTPPISTPKTSPSTPVVEPSTGAVVAPPNY